MGLNYEYRVYLEKERLPAALEYVFSRWDQQRTGFFFENERLFKMNRSQRGAERIALKNFGLQQTLDCSLIFKNDDKIWSYYLNDLCESYHPNNDDDGDFIGLYQINKDHFWVGNIELSIQECPAISEDTVELKFSAVTSDMSILFDQSESIECFFQTRCVALEAIYGCLFKEAEGYRLIWYESEACSYDLANWHAFDEYGFIPVIRRIMQNQKRQD